MRPYYDHAGITIYHGDCREVLPTLTGPVDLVLTDPPYGISHSSNYTCATTTAEWMNRVIEGDSDTSLRDFALMHFSEWACFGVMGSEPEGTRDTLIWDKGPASGMGDLSWPWKRSWECIFLAGREWGGRRDEGVLKGMTVVTRASMGRTHPNEKPVNLMVYLLNKHPGRVVLDPFIGSGPTLVATKLLGRRGIGIEIEERYCEIAAKRLSQEVLAM